MHGHNVGTLTNMTNVFCHCCQHTYTQIGSFTFLSALASLMKFCEYHYYETLQNYWIYIRATHLWFTQSATNHKARQKFLNLCVLLLH